jgi:hypothetical protein
VRAKAKGAGEGDQMRLVVATVPRLYDAIVLALRTGAWRGECLALRGGL